jgi:hypothetical protein
MKIVPGTVPLPDEVERSEASTEDEKWVRCAACGARLAPAEARIDVNGAHEHSFMNPSGLRFVVVCFGVAPGCNPLGEPSAVWTWFPGHSWQVALCKGCGTHVGWSFQAAGASVDASFHGLILDRIAV